MSKRHKVFASFHHDNDDGYRKVFEFRFDNKHNVTIYGGVQPRDIPGNILTETVRQRIRDDYLQDTSVTAVLVGTETRIRSHFRGALP